MLSTAKSFGENEQFKRFVNYNECVCVQGCCGGGSAQIASDEMAIMVITLFS